MDLVLASKSPRRKELLRKITADFRIVPSSVDEGLIRNDDPVNFAVEAAAAKAKDVGEKNPSSVVLGADTIVSLNREIIGKPADIEDARRILEKLSGKMHRVITGVALYKKDEDRLLTCYAITRVKFRELSRDDIEAYLQSSHVFDKAGSYAVQETGDRFVERVIGDYNNVVGLPVGKVKKLMTEFFAAERIIPITRMALPEIWGVGSWDGKTVRVPGAVAGDTAKVRRGTGKKSRYATMVGIEKPSPFRTEPQCPHFGVCGGCVFQHVAYDKQLEWKEEYLLRTLEEEGGGGLEGVEFERILPSPDIYYYRNKMEFSFGGRQGTIILGMRERSTPLRRPTRRTASLDQCPIFSRAAEKILPLVLEFARKTGLPPYDPSTGKGFFRNLVLREGKSRGEIMALLITKSGGSIEPASLAEQLKDVVPGVKSVWRVENDRLPDLVAFEKKHLLFGAPFIEEKLGGLTFRITPESFFQPNPRAAEILYGRIVHRVRALGCRRVLGLYCGPGSIEIFLSPAAGEVIGIDSDPANIAVAEENGRRNGASNCRFRWGSVEDIMKELFHGYFDLLVVDPPRAGLSTEALKRISELAIPAMIYVSCNPAAFARDYRLLAEKGYRLKALSSLDFLPHTPRLESLALLSRE